MCHFFVSICFTGDENTKICGLASAKCYQLAEKNLTTNAESFRVKCNCLPACIFIEYNAEIDRVPFNMESMKIVEKGMENMEKA